MDRSRIAVAVRREREALVDDLRNLQPDDWERPSLCDGWAVRDVVGHLIGLEPWFRYQAPFVFGTIRRGFRPNVWIDRDARRRARGARAADLLDAFAATRYETTLTARLWLFPAVPISELIVHGQDIRRPLGLARTFVPEELIAVAALLASPASSLFNRKRPKGVRFEATDLDWSWGRSGPLVRAPMEELVLRLAGRDV